MATPSKFTAEELAALTDEEREGLEDDSIVDEGDDAATAEEDDAGEDDAQPEKAAAAEAPDAKAEEEPEKKAAEPEKPAAAAEEPAKPVEAEQPAPADTRAALPQYEVPADVNDQLEAIKTKRRELAQKFDDGEITAAERAEQDDQLLEQRDALKEMMLKATIARDSAIHAWSRNTVPGWLAKHAQYEKGSPLYAQLNEEVKRLQAEGGDPFDPGILDKAHGNIQAAARAALGLPPETPKKPAPDPKAPKRPSPPPTLQSLPAADPADIDDGGEYAYLDRLADKDPLAYEAALSKLEKTSPDKFNEYMAQ